MGRAAQLAGSQFLFQALSEQVKVSDVKTLYYYMIYDHEFSHYWYANWKTDDLLCEKPLSEQITPPRVLNLFNHLSQEKLPQVPTLTSCLKF